MRWNHRNRPRPDPGAGSRGRPRAYRRLDPGVNLRAVLGADPVPASGHRDHGRIWAEIQEKKMAIDSGADPGQVPGSRATDPRAEPWATGIKFLLPRFLQDILGSAFLCCEKL